MEDKLAETAPKRPLALTIGAAAVTILVIAGVFAAPTVVTCFNSPDGMGQCIRGKFAEAGLFPTPPATVVADVEAPAPVEEPAPAEEPATEVAAAPEADLPPPALDVTPPVDVPENIVAATFGLLRAEPDGSVVIAGSGTPGSEVEVYSNGSLLGRATVETSGDWVLVPDAPLPPGGVEITLAEKGKTGAAEQSFVVVIDEDKTTQPLVVASAPGQATEILQGLDRPSSSETTQLAAADPVTAPEATTPAAEPAPVSTTSAAPAAETTTPAAETPVAEAPAAEEPDVAVAAVTETPEPTAEQPATPAATEPVSPAAAPEAPTSGAPATRPSTEATPDPADQPTETQAEPATSVETPTAEPAGQTAETAIASTDAAGPAETPEAAPAEPAIAETPAVPSLPPSIDAIEIEGDRTFFAGGGPEGGVVRLYVDDQFVADATVEGGRWLVEAGAVLDEANQRVRADLLAAGSSDVAARAEVDFVVELPETETDVASADVPAVEPVPATPDTVEQPAPAAAEATPAAETPATETPAAPEPTPAPQPDTPTAPIPETAPTTPTATEQPTAEPTTSAPPEPTSTPDATPPADPRSIPEPTSAPAPTTAPEPTPAAEQPAPVPTPATPAPEPAPVTPAPEPTAVEPAPAVETPAAPATEATAEPAVPTMVAVSVGGPDAQRFAAGKAIIRRGDNLWTIARRVYGEGIKYTTIYQANTGQIRDPDRIYPGQVFDLPN